MAEFVEVTTRQKLEGAIDKIALIDAMAQAQTTNREFCEAVLAKLAGVGSGADEQAAAWCQFVEGLPYRRELVETFRDPMRTMVDGGDCDDLTVLCLAGLKCLAIPCLPEALCDEEGWAFHVRVLVGLPPMDPKVWTIADPVWESERRWAMIDVPSSSLPIPRDTILDAPVWSMPSSSTTTGKTLAAVALGGILGVLGMRAMR
jgi:hypothetical protein